MEMLGPLSQVAWLLQVNKTTDEDAAEIKQRCSELSSVQVQTTACDVTLIIFRVIYLSYMGYRMSALLVSFI